MWEDIALTIASSICEALFTNWVNEKKSATLRNKITTTIREKFAKYADTSLDTNDFYEVVNEKYFVDIIKTLYCSIQDGLGTEEYIENVENYIFDVCPKADHVEVRRFLRELRDVYEENLKKLISDNSDLNSLFHLMTISHRSILSKISESEENMKKYFDSLKGEDTHIMSEDIKLYHDLCKKEYGIVRFTGISGAENKPVQDINRFYVENTFSCYSKIFPQDNFYDGLNPIEDIKLKDFFKISNRIVLIGGAGLGKSTTLNYLFCNFEKMYETDPIKVKIDLKEYAKEIGENKKDLLWCISTEFSKKTKRAKLVFEDIEKAFSEFLDKGKCLIIFDALDEIPTQRIRDQVRDEIATFCELYYLNKYIISSREAGYLKNCFNDSFFHIKINDFGTEQIEKYSENWFRIYYPGKKFKEFWEKFKNEVNRARCDNLIRNPIVLILALVIFDIEKNLPNRRVEFYKKCIETFLTVREDRKQAFVLSEKAKNILGIDLVVPKIAHYKYSHLVSNIGYRFNYEELKKSVFEAIEVEDEINWGEAVRQYSEYLVTRTELIREVDEDLYDFAHKTFYEYFLAVYYTKIYDNDSLKNLLIEWIGDSNNDELARLIIEVIIQKDDPTQHKAIIDHLFNCLNNHKMNLKLHSSENEIFLIIADLYSSNMLQPKFHTQYHRTILFRPKYVDNARFFRFQSLYDTDYQGIKYDSEVLSEMFRLEYTNNKLPDVIDSLFYLDSDFNSKVTDKLQNDRITNISNLFFLIRKYNSKKISAKKDKELSLSVVAYFLNKDLECVLTYPQVYISIFFLIYLADVNVNWDNLFDFKFSKNSYFQLYSSPLLLYLLMNDVSKDKYTFLLTLVLLIHCGMNGTNYFLNYVFENERFFNKKRVFDNDIVEENSSWIYNILNQEEYDVFKKAIIERDLFIENQDSLYQKMYIDYTRKEKKIGDKMIKRSIEERKLKIK